MNNAFKSTVMDILRKLGLVPETRFGTTRVVLVYDHFGLALKLPIFKLRTVLKILRQYLPEESRFLLWMFLKAPIDEYPNWSARCCLLKGLRDNWHEFLFSMRHKDDSFVFPTTFSLFGLINVTPLGTEIRNPEALILQLEKAIGMDIARDGHHFTNGDNFCYYKGAIRIRDYGSPKTRKIILEHKERLNALPIEPATG